jgi:hypothetical protein
MIGCQTDVDIEAKAKISDVGSIPEGFPAIDFPEDNTFSLERWKLGKSLFFE